MSSVSVHEFVSRTYDPQHPILAAAQDAAFDQLVEFAASRSGPIRVLELGVGTGHLLERLGRLPYGFEFTGVDVSAGMLEQAMTRVRMRPIECSADQVQAHLAGETFDLIIAHFLLAYIPVRQLLASIEPLLAQDGAVSIVTSINEPFANPTGAVQAQMRALGRSWNPVRRAFARFVKAGMEKNSTPYDIEEVEQALDERSLAIDRRVRGSVPTILRDASDAYRFCVDEGWFLNVLPGYVPMSVMKPLLSRLMRLAHYPLRWMHCTEAVLARHESRGRTP